MTVTPVSAQTGIRTAAAGDPEAARRFAMDQAWEGNRDRWGRPQVMLPDGSREVGYRRASSYGSPLESDANLTKWKLRQVARGVARKKTIALAVTRAEVGLDSPDWKVQKKAKSDLDGLCEDAMEAVGSGDAASIGTSEHDILELIDRGRDPGHIPDEWQPDVDAYRQMVDGTFETVSAERIVVQDAHQVGGKLDRALLVTRDLRVDHPRAAPGTVIERGSILLGDVKTAQSMDFAGCKFGVQCWSYATGVPYDPIGKVRIEWGHEAPRTDWAVILHVPSGQGRASLYWVDLNLYAKAAEEVRRVYQWRNRSGKTGIARAEMVEVPEDFHATAAAAQSVDELLAAYDRAVDAGAWNEVLKKAFGRRKNELSTKEIA